MKYASERFTTIGSVSRDSSEFTAVSVMFSATSLSDRWEKMLAMDRPGEAASNIRPTASSGINPKQMARAKQTVGSSRIWQTRATTTLAGRTLTPKAVTAFREYEAWRPDHHFGSYTYSAADYDYTPERIDARLQVIQLH
jgi:hypothetical protein